MKACLKHLMTVSIIAFLFVALSNMALSRAEDLTSSNTLNQTTDFLSTVVGLNLTEYSLLPPLYHLNNNSIQTINSTLYNPSEIIGVNTQTPTYDFESEKGTLHVLSLFYNGKLAVVNIDPVGTEDNYFYSSTPGPTITDQAKNLLTKYVNFASQEYQTDTSSLKIMSNILSSTNFKVSSSNFTIGNINFQSSQSGNRTKLQWIYCENSVIMNFKRLEMDFNFNNLESFLDTWNIYKVSELSTISVQQATKIALSAAENVNLTWTTPDNINETIRAPDLSNAPYEVQFNMLPYRGYDPNFPSVTQRDPLTLYPYWQFQFYFNQTVAGCDGIQVGVWGDTSEIIYASGFGHLGIPSMTSSNLPSAGTNYWASIAVITLVTAIVLVLCLTIFISGKRTYSRKIRKRKNY